MESPSSILDLFHNHVRDQPDAVAVSKAEASLTYSALDQASDAVAGLLERRGVVSGDQVPLISSRCLELAICVLAILKVGAAFVPMEAGTWSRTRINTVLGKLDFKVAVVTGNENYGINMIRNNDVEAAIKTAQGRAAPTHLRRRPLSPRSVAYIIFTSGTTSTPKGVCIAHESLLNCVAPGHDNAPFNFGVQPGDTTLALFSIAFDIFYGALFNTICNGGCVLLSEASSFINDAKKCTILPATPALLGAIVDVSPYSNIRTVFIGGEASPPSLIKKWSAPNRRLWNGYGPTETTISLTMGELHPGLPVTLGTPIRNSKIILLDSDLKEDDEGEICVAGSAVLALGYFKDLQKTEQKFIQWHGERLYLTGDLAKRTKNGLIFLGRKDQMVKNRGFLINIEAEVLPAILSQPGVESAAAIMHRQRLVAYITPASVDGEQMRQHMQTVFDQFIVPDKIYTQDRLPQTTNGKIDHRSLFEQLSREHMNTPPIQPTPAGHLFTLRTAVGESLDIPSTYVNVNSSFTDLGGNSLLGIKLISNLRLKGFSVSTTALFSLPSITALSDALEVIEDGSSYDGLLDQGYNSFTSGSDVDVASLEANNHDVSKTSFAMTDVQKGIIRSSLNDPPTGYMLVSISLHVPQTETDGNILSEAWKSVLARYELFRSSFEILDSSIKASKTYVHNWRTILTTKANMSHDIEQESEILLKMTKSGNRTSNLFTPINAFRLFTAPERSSVLLWLVHHSLVDGWSVGEILRRVRQQMDTGRHDVPTKQFSLYSNALSAFSRKTQKQAEEFWCKCLKTFSGGTSLNIWNQREPLANKGAVADESINVGPSLAQLNLSARSLGVSSAVILHTAWAVLLGNYADKDEVVFGSVFSGRAFPAAILIADYQWSASQMLQRLAPGTMTRLFQTALFLEYDLLVHNPATCQDVHLWDYERKDWPEFGLTMQVQQAGGEMILRAVYKSDKYPKSAVLPLLHHFRNIYLALLEPTVTTMGKVKEMMLSLSDRLTLTRNSPLLFEPCSGPQTLQERFEAGVECWPDTVAIESNCDAVTYLQLDRISNFLARLISRQARRKEVVAVLGDGSKHWLICALAVIKAGATYLPLDTKLPGERMKVMMQTAGARLCIYPNWECFELRPSLPGERLLAQGHIDNFNAAESITEPLKNLTDTDDYAYIMFTSGSTGAPKGVRVTHRATLSHLSFEPARLHARPGRRHAQIFSPGFDVNIAEIFGTLCYGATLVLKDHADPFAHLRRVNATMATPSFLSTLPPTQFDNLDTIYLIGEEVPQVLCDSWAIGRTLYNFYGPCECSIAATYTRLQPGRPVTLGKAVPRVGSYIFDRYQRPVPVGVIGEIYLSGLQVMDGYIGEDSEAISRAFSADPFVPNHRMYRTGDLGVWTPSMDLKFLGRVDHQVKVRGYRIELDELEHLIRTADGAVNNVAAMVVQDSLYAFVTPAAISEGDLINSLRQKLPSYAVPQRIFALQSLPITPNQKLDRKALADMTTAPSKIRVEALTEIEQLVERTWCESIGLEGATRFGPDDDFLVVGGNSLSQITVARKICAELGQSIPLGLFIKNSRMSLLAKAIEKHMAEHHRTNSVRFECFKPSTDYRLSYLEKMRFDMHEASETPSSLNVAHIVTLSGIIQVDLLKNAIKTVFSTSDTFKTCFSSKNQSVRRILRPDIPEITHKRLPSDELVSALVDTPFDLETGPLTRLALVEHGEHVQMIFVQHHIITDQSSIRHFFTRVGKTYSCLLSGTVVNAKPPRPYAAWAQWKNCQMEEPLASEYVKFWKSHLRNVSDPLHRCPRPPKSLRRAAHAKITRLRKPASAAALGLYLGVTALAWSRVFKTNSACIAIPWIDRAEPGTGDMFGLFLNALPVCIPTDQKRDIGTIVTESIAAVKSTLSYALPIPQIRQILQKESLFDVVLVYNRIEDQVAAGLNMQGILTKSAAMRAPGSKYPVLIEFTEDQEHINLEMEYFEEAMSTETAKQLEEELHRILERL